MGQDVSLTDLVDLLSGSPARGQRVQTPFVSAPAIGKLQKVMGSVTITRANVIVAQPAVGDLVYEGDLIETGIDGLIAIVFVDGTTFRLYDSAHMVLDEFVFSAERSSNSALFRVLKGRFSFLSGLVATTGRLIIDTAVARIQNTRPAAGIGGLAFSVFTIGLIHELNAASADIALLDDGTITCKDLKHGVFEIVTKGDHPQRFIVDDPCVSINFQIVGSQVRVSEVANTPGQMALFHEAFLSTLDSFLRGQQDSLIQKWQHANAEPQSTTTVGSSTQLNGLNNVTLLLNENGGTLSTGNGTTNTTTTTTANLALPPLAPPPPPSNIIIWTSSSPGTWETAPNWNADAVPTVQDIVEINVLPTVTSLPLMVTVDEPESVGSLVVGAGVVLDIIGPNGSLIVSNGTINNAGTIEATSGGTLTIDPSMLTNSGLLEANGATLNLTDDIVTNTGTVEAAAAGIINLQDTTIDGGTVLTAAAGDVIEATSGISTISDATVNNAGTLEANGATLNLTDDIVTNTGTVEATGTGIINLQETTIDGGTVSTIGTSDLIEATSGTSTISDATISNAGTLEANGAELDLVDSTVANTGTVEATGTEGIIDLRGATINGGTVSTAAAGDVIEATSGISTISGATVSNAGTIEATDLATLTIDSSTINNSGLLEATGGGTLVIDGNVTGGGSAAISGGGMLELGGTDAQAVAVSGAGTLKLDGSSDFTGTVAGLAIGDVIDLANTIVATAVWNGSTLTVNGTPTTFTISGLPSGDTFFFTSDGAGRHRPHGRDRADDCDQRDRRQQHPQHQAEAAAGFTISGTAADSGVGVNGQTVTVDIVDGSDKVVDSYTGTVQSDGSWSVNVSSTDAQALSNGSYTVTANLSDVAVNPATETTQTLTVDETPPVITAPTAETIGVGKAALIPGGSLTESGTTAGETFTVIVADTDGLLTVTPGSAGVSNNDSKSVTITGSLGAVSTALGTLSDMDSTPGTDTITVNATDGFGNVATQTTTTITVNGDPVITAPTAETIGVGKAALIPGGSLTESGTTAGETFTVIVADTDGLLTVTPGSAGVSNNDSKSVTITGSLGAVSTALGTLSDMDSTPGTDTITVNATDSFGNVATQTATTITVNGDPVITAPTAETIGVGKAALIPDGSLAESGTTAGETFTVIVADTNGLLTVTPGSAGVSNNDSKSVTITGSLGAVSTALGTLSDMDSTPGTDTITVNATDSFGNVATQTATTITVNGDPVITAPTAETIGVGKAALIPDGSLAESGTTAGETFTVIVADTNGLLTVTPGSAGVSNNDSKSVTITGSLGAVSTALGTLSDMDSTPGTDTITVNATDSFGNVATQTTTTITVNGDPVITAPTAETIGVGKAALIPGGSLTESGTTAGETFTVIVADTDGLLTVTPGSAGVSNNDSKSVTITGSLGAVSTALGTLSDMDSTPGTDTITVNATDGFGNVATQTATTITVNGDPVITAPTAETIGVGKAALIPGGSLTESGTTAGETFTVIVADTDGLLTVTPGSAGVSNNDSKSVTITGSLGAVSTALGTLSDTDSTPGTDTITVNATDGFGNVATQTTTTITVNGDPVITAPTAETIGVGKAALIPGGSLTESGTTAGETFTVIVADTDGLLTVTPGSAGVSNNDSKSVTITGSLGAVSTALGTLSDMDSTPGTDTITVNATDGFGNVATQTATTITVNGDPVITAPTAETIGVGKAALIPDGSLTESGTTAGETFTVIVADTNGLLTVTPGSAGVSNNDSKSVTITGSLGAVSTALGTLSDMDSTPGTDTITVNATDSFGNVATQTATTITVNGDPVITAPTAETIGVGKAALIPGGSLTESGTTAGETFTVIVADTDGLLTVTPGSAGVSNNDSKSVTITGSLGAVSTALGTLSDTDSTPGTDTITVNATDGFGNVATQTTTTITVNTAPILTTPAQTIDVDLTDPITGVVVTETGNTSGEVFTVTLSDSNGDLSANMSAPGGGGTINGSGTTSLTIMGTLVQVNADLATLTDTDGTRGSDPITLTAKDSFGNTATQQIAVTVIDTTTVSETVSALSAAINLVTHGGFETGTLTGWTLGGNYYSAQFPLPQGEIYITSSYSGTPDAQSGQYAVALGSVGSDGTLSQTLQTTVGQQYTLSFWLANETSGPDDFTVTWDGKTLLALTNAPAQGYTEYTYVVTGTGSDVLEFAARQDPSQWNLDSISVLPDAAISLNGGISLNGAVSVSDAPDTADILTTTLTVIHGTINVVATPGGATVANNDSSSVTLTGTAAEIDTSLGATSYIVNPNNPNYGSDSLTATTTGHRRRQHGH